MTQDMQIAKVLRACGSISNDVPCGSDDARAGQDSVRKTYVRTQPEVGVEVEVGVGVEVEVGVDNNMGVEQTVLSLTVAAILQGNPTSTYQHKVTL